MRNTISMALSRRRIQRPDLGFTSSTWSTRLNTRLKLPHKFSVQVRTNISGVESDAQSRTKSYYSIDFGINKILLKDKATIVIDGNNIFNTRTIRYRITGTNYILDQTSNFNAARFRFSFIYRLNKKRASRSEVRGAPIVTNKTVYKMKRININCLS